MQDSGFGRASLICETKLVFSVLNNIIETMQRTGQGCSTAAGATWQSSLVYRLLNRTFTHVKNSRKCNPNMVFNMLELMIVLV